MARLVYGRLTEAWKGEAADFTPLLASQLDLIGEAIGVDLAAIGSSEVPTTGGRRIDIVAEGDDGSEIVIENQYGRADHDHMTRGLAYAIARRARGLVIVAEEHRDEFRALAEYLNNLAELDSAQGISVWLVEAKAVRIADSPWAPLFDVVVKPNAFTAAVGQAKQTEIAPSAVDFWNGFKSQDTRAAVEKLLSGWTAMGYRYRFNSAGAVVLMAPGPVTRGRGLRTVVAVYSDGRVMVPFGSYAGLNSGIGIEQLMTEEFRSNADSIFGFNGTEQLARTSAGWLTTETQDRLALFCSTVASSYALAAEPAVPQ